MALRINFNDIPRDELEYRRYLHHLKVSERDIVTLMDLFRKSKNYETVDGIIDSKSSSGRIVRKKKDVNKENRFYNLLPFGLDNGMICIPDRYSYLLETDECDIETIYNLCMCTKNVHFWFLLTFPQKVNLYNLLCSRQKDHLFGSSNRANTFGDLFDMLNRFCFVADNVTISVIRYSRIPEQTPEMKQMILQNMNKITSLQTLMVYLNDYHNFDPIIRDSLHEYVPFIYYLVHDKLVIKKLNEEDFYINGSPKIKNVSFREPAL